LASFTDGIETVTSLISRRTGQAVLPATAGPAAQQKSPIACKTKSGDRVMSSHFHTLTSGIGRFDVPIYSTAMAGAAQV
jgi:hypothetical protein